MTFQGKNGSWVGESIRRSTERYKIPGIKETVHTTVSIKIGPGPDNP